MRIELHPKSAVFPLEEFLEGSLADQQAALLGERVGIGEGFGGGTDMPGAIRDFHHGEASGRIEFGNLRGPGQEAGRVEEIEEQFSNAGGPRGAFVVPGLPALLARPRIGHAVHHRQKI